MENPSENATAAFNVRKRLKVLGFVEGARTDQGGVGLVGVPHIHHSLAARGHEDHLLILGPPIPTALPYLNPTTASANLYIHSYSGMTKWEFNPAIIRKASALVAASDFITLHSLYSFPVLLGYFLAKRHRKPYGLWPHGVLAPFQRAVNPWRKRLYGSLFARRILDETSILFFSADGERSETDELGLRAKSVVIPHGVDLESFTELPPREVFRKHYMGGHKGPLVLFLGRINAKKGLDILAGAMKHVFAEIPEARLAIFGGGHPPAFIRTVTRWIEEQGINDKTVMTGQLLDADRLAAFSAADVFVLPSEAENFGFAMFEAMACRIPVVVADTLNYAYEVQSNNAGAAVPRTFRDFADAIIRVLRSPDVAKAMGKNGRKAAERYSWQECGRKIETTIQCLLDGNALPPELNPSQGYGFPTSQP